MNRCCVVLLLGSLLGTPACDSTKPAADSKTHAENKPAANGEGLQPQAVLESIRHLGGSGKLNAEGQLTVVDLSRGQPTDAELACLDGQTALRSLKLSGPGVTDAAAKHLQGLARLKVLGLDKTRITDAGLAVVRGMPDLEELYLAQTPIGDIGLVDLLVLKKLKRLRLAGTRVTDHGLALVAQLASLRDLDLSGTPIANAGVEQLKRLAALERVNFYSTHLGNPALTTLGGMSGLKWLNLDETEVTDAGIPQLASLTQLEFLHLGRTQITDVSIDSLTKLRTLKELHVTRTKLSDAGAARLRAALPGCDVHYGPQPARKVAGLLIGGRTHNGVFLAAKSKIAAPLPPFPAANPLFLVSFCAAPPPIGGQETVADGGGNGCGNLCFLNHMRKCHVRAMGETSDDLCTDSGRCLGLCCVRNRSATRESSRAVR